MSCLAFLIVPSERPNPTTITDTVVKTYLSLHLGPQARSQENTLFFSILLQTGMHHCFTHCLASIHTAKPQPSNEQLNEQVKEDLDPIYLRDKGRKHTLSELDNSSERTVSDHLCCFRRVG